MSVIDWREAESLSNLSTSEALLVLGKISEALTKPATQTTDADPRLSALTDSALAEEFAAMARQFHRKAIACHDCRPVLRERADERRQVEDASQKSPEEDASDYARSCKQHLRKG